MSASPEQPPSSVPATARQDGEIRLRWSWVEHAVWTERMLTALEQGVKGGCWFRLLDKVFAELNLFAAARRVVANKGAAGVDHVTVEQFDERLTSEVRRLAQQLREKTFRPQAVRRVRIPKPGSNETRPLGIPTVRDRVVQAAVVNVIEPIFERDLRGTQLWVPSRSRLQRRVAASRRTLEAGLPLRSGRRLQELLRHDPA